MQKREDLTQRLAVLEKASIYPGKECRCAIDFAFLGFISQTDGLI